MFLPPLVALVDRITRSGGTRLLPLFCFYCHPIPVHSSYRLVRLSSGPFLLFSSVTYTANSSIFPLCDWPMCSRIFASPDLSTHVPFHRLIGGFSFRIDKCGWGEGEQGRTSRSLCRGSRGREKPKPSRSFSGEAFFSGMKPPGSFSGAVRVSSTCLPLCFASFFFTCGPRFFWGCCW